MSDSRKKYEDQNFFWNDASPAEQSELGKGLAREIKLTPQEQLQKIAGKQKTEARDKIVELLEELLLDPIITLEQAAKIVEIRKLTFKL